MLVKDEADIIGYVLDHLHEQVDEIYVYDNLSSDGTREILEERGERWTPDPEIGYYQSDKTTMAARIALHHGHEWVLPCDADEVWYTPDGRTIKEYLYGITPDVRVVTAHLYNHFPTALDPQEEENPILRIGWRQKSYGALSKVCVRMRKDVAIEMGNHGAHFRGFGLVVPGLQLRHYSWRSPEQYLKKIRNGATAYAAMDPERSEGYGGHWKMFEGADDEVIMEHFKEWFFFDDPDSEDSLIFDPAPV